MNLTWIGFYDLSKKLGDQLARKSKSYSGIFGVPKGGIPLAAFLSGRLNLPLVKEDEIDHNTLICDDIIDSGATRNRYVLNDFVALFHRNHYELDLLFVGNNGFTHYTHDSHIMTATSARAKEFVVFPWEGSKQEEGEDIVRRMLQYIGEDPTRPGLVDTPKRIVKMWDDVYKGYKEAPPDIMVVRNGEDGIFYDEMIRDEGYFYSHCEHHGVPFFGTYHFAYVPDQLVMGASKIGRTINYYSSKLQVAERLVSQIADRIEEVVKPKGLMLIMDARHLCKEMRGLRMYDSPFGVDVVRGVFRNESTFKQEFLSWLHSKG